MVFTDEQAAAIKQQILKGLEKAPKEQAEQLKTHIESLNNKQLEEFLIKNKLIQQEGAGEKGGEATKALTKRPEQCVYCLIAVKQIEAFAIYEDSDYVAALEINPFSKGHIILIPKKHIKEAKSLPSKAYSLAKRVGNHLVKQLKAKSFQITTDASMGHAIINIIPTYKEPLTYERKQAKKEDLQKLAISIGEVKRRTAKPRAPKPKAGAEIKKPILPQFPRRIP